MRTQKRGEGDEFKKKSQDQLNWSIRMCRFSTERDNNFTQEEPTGPSWQAGSSFTLWCHAFYIAAVMDT